MDTTHRRKHASRVLPGTISVLQEDALIGLMYEDFGRNRFKSLDYNKVRRFALSIQTHPAICSALDSEPVEPAEAWEPPDSCASARLDPTNFTPCPPFPRPRCGHNSAL